MKRFFRLRPMIVASLCLICGALFAAETLGESTAYTVEFGAKRETAPAGGDKSPKTRSASVMEKIVLPVGGKTLTVLFGGGEFYMKLADASGSIAFVEETDLPTIADIAQTLSRSGELREPALATALETLYAWPPNLPVYQWTDAEESIFPVNQREFAIESANGGAWADTGAKKSKARVRAPAEGELTERLAREFPSLDPLDNIAKAPLSRSAMRRAAASGSSSLCAAIGTSRVATYPSDIGVFPPKVEYASVTAPIEAWWKNGGDCLGRCGQGCSGAIPGISSNSDVYTKACHNHDVCVDHEGLYSLECNYIFSKAAASAFGDNCTSLAVTGPKKIQENSSINYTTNLLVAGKKIDMTAHPNLVWSLTSDLSANLLYVIGASEGLVVKDLAKGVYPVEIFAKFSMHGLERHIRKKISVQAN